MNDILRTALTYLENNDRLIYSYRGNTFLQGGELYDRDHDGRGRIDCSTLVHLALQGIPYDRSPYATGKTDAFFVGVPVAGGQESPAQKCFAESETELGYTEGYGLARYCHETGLELKENEPLQPGDLVFSERLKVFWKSTINMERTGNIPCRNSSGGDTELMIQCNRKQQSRAQCSRASR